MESHIVEWPEHIDDLKGPLYILTHPQEYDLEPWSHNAQQCLLGEHGPDVQYMAERLNDMITQWIQHARRFWGYKG